MTKGYTEAEGYAASLRQQAAWIDEIDTAPARDFLDADELRAAAVFIEGLHAPPLTARDTRQARVPLADHDEIGRKILSLPWEIQKMIVTITAHCRVLSDDYPDLEVADLAGCISQETGALADAILSLVPAEGGARSASTFDADEAYALFLILDTEARRSRGTDKIVNHLRERVLPVYRTWHEANPHKAHHGLTLPRPMSGGASK